ncbi:hypothetical protein LPJ78_001960 [Coemansia sp. RSA 989]|nr:hypothetical protein LPJ78_001960 [Coemansia sp. RSA 989]
MAAGIYDSRSARQSLGSTGSGSRRHSLLSADGHSRASTQYDYATAWGQSGGDKLSRWRRAYIASDTGDAEGVQSSLLALPDDSRFTTCMAISEDQPLLAVGSGSYDTNMFFVQSLDGQLDVKASFASKFPIYSLAFKSNLLMAGTDRNTSVLYKVDRARLLGFASENAIDDTQGEDGPLVRCVGTYKNKAVKSIDIAAPGSHVPTKRVACVEFAPAFSGSTSSPWPPSSVGANSEMFLSCLGGVINVWDATRNQQALRVEKVSGQPLERAAWSPNAPATLVAAAGVDGTVSILDLRRRGKAVTWRPQQQQQQQLDAIGVNDVAWSPFMPYWLATGSESGEARVWDLRYAAADGACVATLGHPTNYGAVRSVAWSETHADQLSTGTSDRAWRLYALHADSDDTTRTMLLADKRAAEDIGSVAAVGARGSSFYSLSSCGDLYMHQVGPQALKHAAVHRMQGAELEHVEKAVYTRDLQGAAEAVVGLVQQFKAGGDASGEHPIMQQAESIQRLCDLFKAKPRVGASAWTLPPAAIALGGESLADSTEDTARTEESKDAQAAAARGFHGDLAHVAYGLPPGYPLEATASRHPVVWQALEQLNMANLRIRLERVVKQAESSDVDAKGQPLWKAIAERERQLMQYVKAEPALFGAKLLRAAVKLVLPHDCIAGLRLGLGVCQAYLSSQRQHEHRGAEPVVTCAMLDALVHVLLFPTVFDADGSTEDSAPLAAASSREQITLDVAGVRARIGECLDACAEAVFEMVQLEISIQETVMRGGDQKRVAEDIVAVMQRHARSVRALVGSAAAEHVRDQVQLHARFPATTTLSASAVRLYLNSLLSTRAYDEHLANSQWWRMPPAAAAADAGHAVGSDSGWLSSYALARVVNRQTATAVVPRMQRQIDVVLATIKKEPLGLEPRLFRDTLLKVGRIWLSVDQEIKLEFETEVTSKDKATGASHTAVQRVRTGMEGLAAAFEEIGGAFLMLMEALTRHSSHRDAFRRAAGEARPLHEALAALVAESQQSDPQLRERGLVIRKYLRKLDHYAKNQPPEDTIDAGQ